MRLVDYINHAEDSRIAINDWVEEQTEGKIEDLLQEGTIDSLTRLVLTNAIYFNAAWEFPFDEQNTGDGTFYTLDGTEITVPMMNQTESFGYAAGDGYVAVELPYDGNELSMVILLPDMDDFTAFEDSLDADQLNSILDDVSYYADVNLTMPKFEFESDFDLVEPLMEMGMPVAFTGSADFSGMTGNNELSIGDVVHKAFVSVDEAGTEAAAATAAEMALTAMPEIEEVTVDHPFIFLIRDIETETILFTGRVVNPSA